MIQHEVRISGLAAGTRYYYSVGTAQATLGGGTAQHYFDTAPTPGVATPVRMWVVGDSGTGGARQGAVRDAMLAYVGANRPELFIHVGDMAYADGLDSEFQDNFFAMYPSVLQNTVTWPALGNHEGHSADSDTESGPYYEAYSLPTNGSSGGLASGTEAYYAFDWGNIHFIVLDSHDSPRESTGTMATWLTADLASTNADWIIAFWHHPPYTKGSHDSDAEGQLIDMREEILPILEAGGVDLVLGGHSHIYERSYLLHGAYDTPTTAQGFIVDPGSGKSGGDGPYLKPAGASEGAVYVVAGHGGTGVRGAGNHPVMYFSEVDQGSCIVDVDGPVLTLHNIRHDGVVTDEFTLVRSGGVFLLRPAADEVLQAGSTYPIRWLATDTRAVHIEYSGDDGATWTTIAAEVPQATSYDWTVPATPTVRGRIRVTDADDATRTATNARPFIITNEVPQVVLPFGAIWKYDDDGGAYPDDGWTAPGFDDAAWKSGPAELGYGDGDEVTALLDADPNIPSVLFRHTVDLERPVASALLEAVFDDAIAVWINGTLVHTVNLPQLVGTDSYAAASSGDNAATRKDLGPENPFVPGPNVIAAMVKQTGATSSDLSFNLQLTITYQPDVPTPPADMGNAAADGGTRGPGDLGRPGNPADAAPGSDATSPVSANGDGGTNAPGGNIAGEGACNCSTTAGPTPWLLLLAFLGLVGAARRRRARKPFQRF